MTAEEIAQRRLVRELELAAALQGYRRDCVREAGLPASVCEHATLPVAAPAAPSAPLPAPLPASVPPEVLARRAYAELAIAFPGIQTSPPPENPSFVQIPTWLWIDGSSWHPVSSTAVDGPLEVTVSAEPVAIDWDMGNGDRVVCDGPGTPYDYRLDEEQQSSDCTYTYKGTSAKQPDEKFLVTAQMVWRAWWHSSDGDHGAFPPVVVSGSVRLSVAEIQALGGG